MTSQSAERLTTINRQEFATAMAKLPITDFEHFTQLKKHFKNAQELTTQIHNR